MFFCCPAAQHNHKDEMVISMTHKRNLTVMIVGCRGLRDADWFFGKTNTSDAFVTFGKHGDLSHRTSVKPNSVNPEWNYEAVIDTVSAGESLEFKVWDQDKGKPDDLLGQAFLTPHMMEHGFFGEVELQHAGKTAAFITLKVHLPSLAYPFFKSPAPATIKPHPPVYHNLVVLVHSAKGLRDADWGKGKSDCFCTFGVAGKTAAGQTKVAKDTLDPVWNEEATIVAVPEGGNLEFKVWDKDPAKPDDLLGKVLLAVDTILKPPIGYFGEVELSSTGLKKPSYLTVKVKLQGSEFPHAKS